MQFKYFYNFKKIAIQLFILLPISILLVMSACQDDVRSMPSKNEKLVPSVEAIQARYGSLPLSERLTGVVRARNQVEIFPEINAAIVEVRVENGDIVEKDQPLVLLRDRDFQERLKQAKANYKIALAQSKQASARLKEVQSELKRMESLAEKELVSDAELEEIQTRAVSEEANVELAKARVEQAQAAVEESQTELSETIIRAPISGTVGNRNAEVGMIVSPGVRLFTMGQLDNMKIEVVLTDRMLNYIEVGQRSEIFSDVLPSGMATAPLSRISPFLHPVTHSTTAEIDLKNPDGSLKPGMFVTVDVMYGESEQATLIPLSALYENPETGETGVFVSRDSLVLHNEPTGASDEQKSISLSDPITFDFKSVDVMAKGRMQAGINGVDKGNWVVTLGQNLLGSQSGEARVRTVKWDWVEYLQNLQSQDLLEDIMEEQQKMARDSINRVIN